MRHIVTSCVLACLGVCLACQDGTTDQVNSNTNWLTSCAKDSECDGTFSCMCGLCTSACNDACGERGGQCVKPGTLSHALQCDSSEDTALCLGDCDDQPDLCAADQVCVAGACSKRATHDSCAAHADALVCSSFESEALVTDSAALITGVELQQSKDESFFGNGSLAASCTGDKDRSRARYDFDVQTAGALYLRAWMYLDVKDVADVDVHSLTVGSVDTADFGTDFHFLDGKLGFNFPDQDIAGSRHAPARQWFCMRAEITLGTTDGSASVWLNDELSATAKDINTLPTEGARNLSVGIDYSKGPDARLLVDDVLLSTKPASCLE